MKASFISGKAYWASVVAPNTTFDSDGTWKIDVYDMDKKSLATVKEDGLTIKNKDDDRGNFVTIKRDVRRVKGGVNRAPTLVDAQKRTMSDLVGNGSVVNVKYRPYTYDNKYGKGQGADLMGVQVIELVRYETDPEDEDEDFEVVSEGFSTEEEISFAS